MADAPWIKWFTSDFLNGVADLEADEIGVYAVLLNLQADRGAPVEDDSKWLARRCGTSTRRFNQVRARLISLGKLEARAGMLANRRMLSEVEKRDSKSTQARAAALARWHNDDAPELPLANGHDGCGNEPPTRARAHGAAPDPKIKSKKTGGNSQEQTDLKRGKSEPKPQKTANSDDADASLSVRARRVQKLEDSDPPLPDSVSVSREAGGEPPAPDRLNNGDLRDKVDAVCEAAGYRPISPGQIDRAYRIIEEWTKEGFDFDQVVIPTIRAVVAESRDPTRTLGRFSARIRHEQARLKASGQLHRPYAAPPSPVLEVEGEEPVMRTIREELLQRIGVPAYCSAANAARLERVKDAGGNRVPLRVIERGPSRLNDGGPGTALAIIAKRHGFTEVW